MIKGGMPNESQKPNGAVLAWNTTVTKSGDGRAIVTAQTPLGDLSVAQAAKILGCTSYTVRRAFRAGLITGSKPGAIHKRSDGRESNAALVLDAQSVLNYKESVTQRGMH